MKMILTKTTASLLIMMGLVAILITSCKKNDNTEVVVTGDANIRITNTVLGSLAQDFYQADLKISTIPVAYGEFSNYLKVKAGGSVISFKNTGSTTSTATANVGLNTNGSYTAFYYANGSGATAITGYLDDNTVPATGKARLRFINLGAFNNTLNVLISGGASIVTGLAFDTPSAYTSIDAGVAIDVTVLNSGINTTIPGSNFQVGKIYTVWFDAASFTTAKYHLIVQN